MNQKINSVLKYLSVLWVASLCHCAAPLPKPEQELPAGKQEELQRSVNLLIERFQTLDTKLNTISEKMDTTRMQLELLANAQKNKTAEVPVLPIRTEGSEVNPPPSPLDPELGYVNDEAIQDFRKAMILYLGQKYPEAILALSSFVEKNPDHTLAGSAQYYVARSYFNQKEFKLAVQEFKRVLASYDRSPHITDALADLTSTYENLKNTEEAAKTQQLLTSLFPQSPAAWKLNASASAAPPSGPTSTPSPSSSEPPPTAPLEKPQGETEEPPKEPSKSSP